MNALQNPLALLAHTQQQLLGELELCATHLPFIGGALGYFGYDLGRYIEKLPATAEADISLPDMAVGFYRWALILDKQLKQLWYVDYHGEAEAGWQKLHARLQHKLPQRWKVQGLFRANLSNPMPGKSSR